MTAPSTRIGEVEVTIEGGIGTVTLDAPQRRNALTPMFAAEIVQAVDVLEHDERISVLIIAARGPAFCAGADLRHLDVVDEPALRAIYSSFLRVRECRLPTIAAVGGPAVGAGLNLAMACDVRVASRAARFDSRFITLGVHPGGGASWMLTRSVGRPTTAAMLMFDETIDGATAERVGLAWSCVENDDLQAEVRRLAERVGNAPRELVIRIKSSLDIAGTARTHEEAVEAELEYQLWSFGQSWYSDGRRAGRSAPPEETDESRNK